MIELSNHTLSLSIGCDAHQTKALESLELVYCVMVGSDVLANDSLCYLFVFDDSIWLLPEDTSGVSELYGALETAESHIDIVYATVDYLPYLWRSKWMIFPGTTANLKVLNRTQLSTFMRYITVVDSYNYIDLFWYVPKH